MTCVCVFGSAPLPAAGVPDVAEALGAEGRAERDRARHVRRARVRGQAAVLLLAALRRQPLRQEGAALQVLECAILYIIHLYM